VKEASEIEFQVRSGKREEIPNVNDDEYLVLLSATIEIAWNQNPSKRPTFKQIDQKFISLFST